MAADEGQQVEDLALLGGQAGVVLRRNPGQQRPDGVIAEAGRARVVGQPELEQTAQPAEVAIHAHQVAHVLEVGHALDLVALADRQQVGGRAHAGGLGVGFDGGPFVRQAIDLDGRAALPRYLVLVGLHLGVLCRCRRPPAGPAGQDAPLSAAGANKGK